MFSMFHVEIIDGVVCVRYNLSSATVVTGTVPVHVVVYDTCDTITIDTITDVLLPGSSRN